MAQHDGSYKLLFSHPEMVRDLLLGFVHEDWVQELDFDSLELVKNSFTSTQLHARDEDLIRQNQVKAGDLLPPVLPIVLYNGAYRWSSAVSVQELIEPVAGFEHYRPHLSYLLLDQQHYQDLDEVSHLKNLVAALFELENSRTAHDIQQVVLKLLAWLTQPEQETLRRAFATWLNRVLIPNRLLPTEPMPVVNSLQEVNAMLAETVQKWYAEAEAQGMARGLKKGLQQGLKKGKTEGLATSLLQLLTVRFGAQPDTIRQQIAQLNEAQLMHGLTQVLTAHSVAEVLSAAASVTEQDDDETDA